MTQKSDQKLREAYGDVVVASPSEKTQARFCQCGHSEHRHLESPAPTGLCIEEGCECERWSERKAAQDAPPAPREQDETIYALITRWRDTALQHLGAYGDEAEIAFGRGLCASELEEVMRALKEKQ